MCQWAAGLVPAPHLPVHQPCTAYFHQPLLNIPSALLYLPTADTPITFSVSLYPLGFSSHPVLNLSLNFRAPSGLSEDSSIVRGFFMLLH